MKMKNKKIQQSDVNYKIYTLSEYKEAANLVNKGKYVHCTMGCAYKLIINTQSSGGNFIEFINNIMPYLVNAKWNKDPKEEHFVCTKEPKTGKTVFIGRAPSESDFDIALSAVKFCLNVLIECETDLDDYATTAMSMIIRGSEGFFDINLNTTSMKIDSSIWAGIMSNGSDILPNKSLKDTGTEIPKKTGHLF